MSKLCRFVIEKTALEALPDRERGILLGAGKLLNEINLGTKYLMFSMNAVHASKDGPDKSAAFTALSFFLRILAGHVFEAYEYFRKMVRVDELRKSHSSILDTAFYSDVKALNTYFGKTNIISQMRQKFSFHTDLALLRKSFECVPAGFTYEVLLGQEYAGHNIWFGSEMMIIDGIQHLKPHTRWEDAINSAFEDTTYIAHLVSKVFQRTIGSIMADHLKITMDDAERVAVTDGPTIDTVLIPFFCQPPIRRAAQ